MHGSYAKYDAVEHNNDEGTWAVYVSQWLQSQTGSADPLDSILIPTTWKIIMQFQVSL